jgi:hypothetical protein
MRTLFHTPLAMPLVWLAALLSSSPAFGDTITVANTNDNGAGSLRAAIESAAPNDIIVFSLPHPAIISLTSGSLAINTDLTIAGPGASTVTIDASGNSGMERAFTVGSGVTVTIAGVTVTGGGGGGTSLGSSADSGGGIFNSGTLTLRDAVISNNSTRSQGIGGGGIFNAGGATLTLTNCLVWGNTAGGDTIQQGGPITGGGIRNANSGLLTLTNTTVSNNAAHVGGGIWNNGTLTVTGSSFSGNSAGVNDLTNVVLEGGAVYVSGGQGTGSIINSTFFNNSAKSNGAAIANAGTLGVTNSTFSENSTQMGTGGAVSNLGNMITLKGSILSNAGGNCSVSGGLLLSQGYNLSTDASCSLSGSGDLTGAPAGLDPAGLQDHGGSTQTIALLSASAAVDRIPTPCTDLDDNPLSTDQRGVTRPQGNQCDIGAFELIGPAPTITSFTPTSGPVGASVTITGSAFIGATAVAFNGTNATSFTLDSETQITTTVPTGATTGPIAVTTPGGTTTSVSNFTVLSSPSPTITSFSPLSGGLGASVTINGHNLNGATSVRFGGASAQYTISSNGRKITAIVPVGATSGPIAVTTPVGTATSGGGFTVIPAPTIADFTPVSGPGGTSVTINGANFTDATAVMFNGRNASFTVNASGTQITATVPRNGLKPGSIVISVTTPGGTATSGTTFTLVK